MSPQSHRHQRAFTFVESLVVMMTIILLASILIPGLLGRKGKEPEMPEPKVIDAAKVKPVTPAPTTSSPKEDDADEDPELETPTPGAE